MKEEIVKAQTCGGIRKMSDKSQLTSKQCANLNVKIGFAKGVLNLIYDRYDSLVDADGEEILYVKNEAENRLKEALSCINDMEVQGL